MACAAKAPARGGAILRNPQEQTSRPMSVTSRVPITFQGLIQTLNEFWAQQGCVLIQPLDL